MSSSFAPSNSSAWIHLSICYSSALQSLAFASFSHVHGIPQHGSWLVYCIVVILGSFDLNIKCISSRSTTRVMDSGRFHNSRHFKFQDLPVASAEARFIAFLLKRLLIPESYSAGIDHETPPWESIIQSVMSSILMHM